MKVFYDHQVFSIQRYGGASKYLINLVDNLSSDIEPLIISLFYKNQYLKNCKKKKSLFNYDEKYNSLTNYFNYINRLHFKLFSNIIKPKIIHYSYFNEKIFYKNNFKKVITEYDLIKEKFYNNIFLDQINYKKKLFSTIDHIICISENTKKDLVEFYNVDEQKITTIHLGINDNKDFININIDLKPFILFVGSRDRYKNFENAIKAYSYSNKIKSEFNFLCFGGGGFTNKEQKLFNSLSLQKNKILHFEGDDEILKYFYKKARIFIFPSLYEGFGLPVLEAMNMGCPVICSNTSSFPEITGGSSYLFDPQSIESIKYSLEKVAFDDDLILSLKRKGIENAKKFTWKKCANQTEKVYKTLV